MTEENEITHVFTDAFLAGLPSDPQVAIQKMAQAIRQGNQPLTTDRAVTLHPHFLRDWACFQAYAQSHNISCRTPSLDFGKGKPLDDILNILTAIKDSTEDIHRHTVEDRYKSHLECYAARFGGGFAYTFSDGDLIQIQRYITDLRELIVKTEAFEEDHRTRLLKKLEKLQTELHKRMSTLDCIWAFVGEAGVVMGKFATDAKPMVDLITKILKIAWAVQARAEELAASTLPPFGLPQLPPPEASTDSSKPNKKK